MKKFRVGVVGVSGYAGLELIKILLKHPAADLVAAMDAAEIGEMQLQEIHHFEILSYVLYHQESHLSELTLS